MDISEEYLKEHNIESVKLISDGTHAPVMLIKINGEVLRVSITQDMIGCGSVDSIMSDIVDDYEQKKKVEERSLKLDKITKRTDT